MGREKIPILVIEDDLSLRTVIRAFLCDSHYEVTMAETLRAATHAFATHTGFQIILCDLTLPDSYPEDTVRFTVLMAKGAPVVAMTGWTDDATSFRCRRDGAAEVLLKGGPDLGMNLALVLDRIMGL